MSKAKPTLTNLGGQKLGCDKDQDFGVAPPAGGAAVDQIGWRPMCGLQLSDHFPQEDPEEIHVYLPVGTD